MPRASDLPYFIRRAQESRAAANCATDQCAAIVHSQLAKEYDRLAIASVPEPKIKKFIRPPIVTLSPLPDILSAANCPAVLTSGDRR